MRKSQIGLAVAAMVAWGMACSADASVIIFSDNFTGRTPNPTTLDTTPASGELGGLLASSVVMKSQDAEQNIVNNQLNWSL